VGFAGDPGRRSFMKRVFVTLVVAAAAGVFGLNAPAHALKIADPTPNAAFTDAEGNQGYIEVASDDGSGALLRACNENDATPAGDDATGYIWVNPSGESTPATYGNATIGAGDRDGEDATPPRDSDGDTNDDCTGNDDFPQ
jgi:hypothetical protein